VGTSTAAAPFFVAELPGVAFLAADETGTFFGFFDTDF
jgi:hypothetical protein